MITKADASTFRPFSTCLHLDCPRERPLFALLIEWFVPVIVRTDGGHLLLITQPDHAALAATIMTAWRGKGFPTSAERHAVLLATRSHDNGWQEDDAAPLVDASNGRILDFVPAPDQGRRSRWPGGIARLRHEPYAAALVAQHAVAIYDRYREHSEWAPFFEQMFAARAEMLSATSHSLEDLARDYFIVRMGDLASLTFCNGWTETQRAAPYDLTLRDRRLVIRPDPFNGHQVPLTVAARRIPDRPYSHGEAAHLFQSAPLVAVSGVAAGS